MAHYGPSEHIACPLDMFKFVHRILSTKGPTTWIRKLMTKIECNI